MPKVYVVNKGGHDYTAAEHFGELVYCTEGSIDKIDLSQMYRELWPELRNSHHEDYILLTSLTSLCSVACAIFAAKHQCLNLLIHTKDGYIPRSVYFDSSNPTKGSNAKLLTK